MPWVLLMSNDLTIETIATSDAVGMADTVALIEQFKAELGAPLEWHTRDALPALLKRREALIILARQEGEPVGVVIAQRNIVTFKASEALNIHDFFVTRSARGSGVGQMLMKRTIAHARSMGCVRVTLEVDTENTNARRFYRASGFELPEDGNKALHFIRLPLD